MKILHIIDTDYFKSHSKIILELILALNKFNIKQKIYTSKTTDLPIFSNNIEVVYWDSIKIFDIFKPKIKTMMLYSSFKPEITIKWGPYARKLATNYGIQMSYSDEIEKISSFNRNDYIISTSEKIINLFKANGFSGMKSIYLPNFAYNYNKDIKLTKKELFIPDRANIAYIASAFRKDIGFETLFSNLSVVENKYFIIAGYGKTSNREYIEDRAQFHNIKAKSRFITNIQMANAALELADFSILPFYDVSIEKYILESMLSKKLVITVRNEITEELITDGKTGFFIPKRDDYLIKKRLKEIIKLDTAEVQTITDNGYNEALQYSEDKIIPKYIETFQNLIDNKNRLQNI